MGAYIAALRPTSPFSCTPTFLAREFFAARDRLPAKIARRFNAAGYESTYILIWEIKVS
jgi:hypothetical protein